ncbi:MAG: dTMP kinase [Candidatus Omnitrophica bacterium]|nr:dTMP kinase [Candidatus Omnitrophota bacterium]HOX53933.1 dTMP kinase [Candidatus Omnitrophota bacterium]
MKGKFITFEGSEGSGKSTHAKLLKDYLKKKGFSVELIREPGGTRISEKIRNIILDPKNKAMTDICETLLYMAARVQIVKEVIKPALDKGKIVICDRFLDSTIVYQGYGGGIDLDLIKKLGNLATLGIKPDLTFLLDIETKEGLRRAGKIKDRIELKSLNYHKRVRKGYLALAKKEPARIKVVCVENHNKNRNQEIIRKYADRLLCR